MGTINFVKKNICYSAIELRKESLDKIMGDNGCVFYLEFTQSSKSEFLKKFRVSILDIENTLRGSMLSYLENSNFYTRDPLYDQFDFIFTNGDRVLLETAIHGGFTFLLERAYF